MSKPFSIRKVSTGVADFIVILEHNHENPDFKWVWALDYDAIITEIPIPPKRREKDFSSSRYPSGVVLETRFRTHSDPEVFSMLEKAGVPIIAGDIAVPLSVSDEADRLYRARKRNSRIRGGSAVAAAAAVAMGYTGHRLSKAPKNVPLEDQQMSRRRFLRKGLKAGAAITGVNAVAAVASTLFSESMLGLEGKSAIMARRAVEHIAPQLSQRLGRKPIIVVHTGDGHADIIKYLRDSSVRNKMLDKMKPELERLPPEFKRYLREVYWFTFHKGKLKRETRLVRFPLVRGKSLPRRSVRSCFPRRGTRFAARTKRSLGLKRL